jgi:hypothetical protein
MYLWVKLTSNYKADIITSMDELLNRLDKIERTIPQIKNKVARRDLLKMLKNIDVTMNAVSRESVECRRLHRETLHHKELIKQAEKLIVNLEQHLTFAALLNG